MTAPDTVAGALVQVLAPDQYPAYEQRIADRAAAPDQAAVLRFAAALADRSADLPAPYYDVSPHRANLCLHVHQGFAAFELWREHLGIPEDEVRLSPSASQTTMRGTLVTPAGITVKVTGYSSALPGVDR